MYDSETGIIHVFDKSKNMAGEQKVRKDVAHSLRHEVGHFADHHLNDISETPEFRAAYEADVRDASDPKVDRERDDDYALTKPREAFAEAFGRKLGGHRDVGKLRYTTRFIELITRRSKSCFSRIRKELVCTARTATCYPKKVIRRSRVEVRGSGRRRGFCRLPLASKCRCRSSAASPSSFALAGCRKRTARQFRHLAVSDDA